MEKTKISLLEIILTGMSNGVSAAGSGYGVVMCREGGSDMI